MTFHRTGFGVARVLTALALLGPMLSEAATVIRYEADTAPPETFVADFGGTGSVSYQDGVVRFTTTSSTGSTGFYTDLGALDPKGSEPFALGMRVRVDVTGSSMSAYSGAVTGFFWGDEQSVMFIGINESSIRWGPNIGAYKLSRCPWMARSGIPL